MLFCDILFFLLITTLMLFFSRFVFPTLVRLQVKAKKNAKTLTNFSKISYHPIPISTALGHKDFLECLLQASLLSPLISRGGWGKKRCPVFSAPWKLLPGGPYLLMLHFDTIFLPSRGKCVQSSPKMNSHSTVVWVQNVLGWNLTGMNCIPKNALTEFRGIVTQNKWLSPLAIICTAR